MTAKPIPSQVKLHRSNGSISLEYGDEIFTLSGEYLRVHSPSAEVKGHGPGQEILQHGKLGVKIIGLEPMGHYALRLTFDDGHDTGLYSWEYLYSLCSNYETYWQTYLEKLHKEGKHRDPGMQVVQLMNPER